MNGTMPLAVVSTLLCQAYTAVGLSLLSTWETNSGRFWVPKQMISVEAFIIRVI